MTLDKFIRNCCIRKKEHILNPPINDIKNFVLPRNSHLHYLGMDGEEIGIRADNPLLAYMDKDKKVSQFIKGYKNVEAGGFKTVTVKIDEQIRSYYRRNRAIVNGLHSKSDLLLDKNLVITNYALMEAGVEYFTNNLQWFFQHQNRWKSIRDYIQEAASKDRRNHFIIIDIPENMPSVSQLKKMAVPEPSNDVVRKMANSQRMLISDFWNWFEPGLPTCISHDLNLNNRLYYIFRFHDKWICVNPKTLLTFMKSESNPRGDYSLLQMRKNFLVMLLTPIFGAVDLIALDEEEDEEDEPTPTPTDEDKPKLRRDTIDTSVGLHTNPNGNALDAIQDKIKEGLEKSLVEAENVDEYVVAEVKKEKKIDKFLEGLETLNVDAVDATENMDAPEQNILKDDTGEAIVPSIDRSEVVLDYKAYVPKDQNHEEAFKAKLNEQVLKGSISPLQKRRFEKLASRYKEIPNPVSGIGTLEQAALIDPKDLVISKDKKFVESINMVSDESMLKSTLIEFDKKYVDNIMQKDLYNAVMAVQRRGVAVQNYQVKRVKRLGEEYDIHTVKLVPLEGEPSTTSFKVPVINDYGVFQSRSIKMRSRKQRTDVPIRKISHDEVALTSDVSKFFVERSQFAAYSSERWLRGQLVAIDDPNVKIRWGNASTVVEGRVFDRAVEQAQSGKDLTTKDVNAQKRTPLLYSMMGRYVKSIEKDGYELFFNAGELDANFGKDVVKVFDSSRSTQILLGKGKNSLLILTNAGQVHECSITNTDNKELGSLFSFLGIETAKQPEDCADVIMLKKSIPLGMLLGLYLGLGNLLKTLNVDNYFVPKGTRGNVVGKGYIGIQFADGTLMANVNGNYKAQLILAGFKRYKNYIKRFSVYEFDRSNAYTAVFAEAGLPARFMREFSILRDMWVDPIAYGELVAMGEPTDFVMLLIRAAEMLEYDQHPEEMDRAYQRDRGYERISGFVYNELVKSIRVYDSTPVKERAKVSMNPEAVWMDLIGDETTAPIEESNPIHNLKEMETVVYRGAGGRTARTMNANSRKFSRNSIGVDSEATVDNGDAGTVRFLSANPNYNSVRGTVNSLEVLDESVNSSCLNTSFLLAPGLEFDDPKRRNFCQIQNSRTTNSEGARVLPVRTGYERVLPYRTSDLYATMATEEGKVVRVTDAAIVVKYKSGKEVSIELGKRDGKWAGKIIPHQVITNLKEGQKVNIGDAIAFNPMFFEIDTLGGTLAYKSGTLCRVGLVEEEFTFEDASEISAAFADQLVTRNCEERFITVRFDQEVNELVKVGQDVEYDTTLCILQSHIGGVADAYGGSVEALRDISSLTPRAKHEGKVTDISAIYVGDVEEMSSTLQEVVNASDRKLYKKARDLGVERDTGQKRVGERFDGKTLEPNTAIIKAVIDISQDMGIGSKVVYGHQMKSVVSHVWDEVFTTQDGKPYDAKFSYTSFVKRIVKSGLLVGILNTYSVETGKQLWEIYENG